MLHFLIDSLVSSFRPSCPDHIHFEITSQKNKMWQELTNLNVLCLALVCKSVNALTLSLSADARVAACNILSSSMSDNSSWKSTPTLTLIKTQQVKKNKIKSPTRRALSEG